MPRRPPTRPLLPRGRLGSRLFQGAPAAAVPIVFAETAAGSDQLRPDTAVPLLDAAAAAETLQVLAAATLTDQGSAAETLQLPPQLKTLTDSATGGEHLCHDGGPTGAPDCILVEDNLTGPLPYLWDDPQAGDANWLTALDPSLPIDLRVSFPTPATAPGSGGPTEFQALVRKAGGGPDPTLSVQLWEAGAFVKDLATVAVSSTSGQLVTATLTPADLTDPTGAGVELRLRTIGGDGLYHDSYGVY